MGGGVLPKKGFQDLKSGIIDNDLCTRCGACVASCPVEVLENGPDSVELIGECNPCGICSKVCPGGGMDLSFHEKQIFGRSRKKPFGSRLGIYQDKVHITSSSKDYIKIGYYGGRVTSILVAALRSDLIDAALLTDWNEDGHLSIGSGVVARTEDDIRSYASVKYGFTTVLSRLKEITNDPSISSAAMVGLPCTLHGLMKMRSLPETKKLTEKIEYAISLNCGAPQTDERTWKKRIEVLTGVNTDEIASANYRKISSTMVRIVVGKKDGNTVTKEMNIVKFLFRNAVTHHWPRCMMCPDYSGELSDISFGAPVIRTEKGQALIKNAMDLGFLKPSSNKKRTSQNIMDLYVPIRKKLRTRRIIAGRRRKGLPYPIYR
jgi:coenzyme F420 hydrogenase subunit beta